MYDFTIMELITTGGIIVSFILGIVALLNAIKQKQKVADNQKNIATMLENDLKHVTESLKEFKKESDDIWKTINLMKEDIKKIYGSLEFLKGKMNGGRNEEKN